MTNEDKILNTINKARPALETMLAEGKVTEDVVVLLESLLKLDDEPSELKREIEQIVSDYRSRH